MPTDDLFDDPGWYDALTLAERARSAAEGSSRPFDADLAARRLERWRAQPPFDGDAPLFDERLRSDGLSREAFQRLLGETPGGPEAPARALPWLAAIESAFARPEGGAPLPWPPLRRAPERVGFLSLVEPVVRAACERLEAGLDRIVADHPGAPLDPARGRELFLPQLAPRLLMMLSRPLVLELNAARLLGQLDGGTPEERFAQFIRRLGGRDEALRVLATYPVLARQVVERIDQWVEVSLETAGRLAVDWAGLRAAFSPGRDPGRLAAIQGGMGDSHRGGRAVVSLRFESGLDLIYKPRSLAVEAAFQDLLAWAGARGFTPAFGTLRVLDRGEHGWSERVAAAPCADEEAVRRFYERLGGLLALLYVLDAIDVHYENLIAAGEHPVLVDLEGLFHPRTDGDSLRLQEPRAGDALHHCLLRIGLLPQRLWSTPEKPGLDLSGISAAGGQTDPIPVLRLVDAGTDRMRFERREAETDPAQNVPTLGGRPVDPSRYRAEVAAGFERMYRLLLARRGELLAAASPLAAFADAEVRVIVRPTRGYQNLLRESYHPDVLGNALLRDQLFDRLWAGVPHHPYLAELIPAERRALEQGDIPMLATRAGSRDLWTGRGERIVDYFDRSGLERVAGNFQWMGEDDLAFQLWAVEGSLKALSMSTDLVHRRPYGLREGEERAAADELLAEARRVGDRIEELASRGRRDALWLSLSPVGRSHWSFQPVGYELYNGQAGIALFLAYLGARTGEGRYTDLGRAAWVPVEELLETRGAYVEDVGGFSGWGGFLYLLPHLAALWDAPELLDRGEAWLARLPRWIERAETDDFVEGTAGCLAGLLAFHQARPSAAALGVARLCGDRLLARALPMERGSAWAFRANPLPLAGLSHGAAGIAWPLLDLATVTGDDRYRAAALAGLEYERSLYSPKHENWPDLREDESAGRRLHEGEGHYFTAWCHGAAGIGLARLAALPVLDDEAVRAEIEAAVRTTLRDGFGRNHCLCHGDLGNLELLLQAAHRLGRLDLEERAYRLAAGVLAGMREHGWLQGMPVGAELPGLMMGLAGIGYGLLRLADPRHVPGVLTFEPPPRG